MADTRLAIYPGSFDPITNGHLDIIDRSLYLFDRLNIVVASSARKQPSQLLSVDERVQLVHEVIDQNYEPEKRKKISVSKWDGLIMDYARNVKAVAVMRGLRAASDFEYEFMMAAMNKNLNKDVETVFMMTNQKLFFISSTMIKELYRFGGDIGPYVPSAVRNFLVSRKEK
ncbi:MAG: pantetheine-phosphate adenylyltransferase [Bacteriovoracia bacterium]